MCLSLFAVNRYTLKFIFIRWSFFPSVQHEKMTAFVNPAGEVVWSFPPPSVYPPLPSVFFFSVFLDPFGLFGLGQIDNRLPPLPPSPLLSPLIQRLFLSSGGFLELCVPFKFDLFPCGLGSPPKADSPPHLSICEHILFIGFPLYSFCLLDFHHQPFDQQCNCHRSSLTFRLSPLYSAVPAEICCWICISLVPNPPSHVGSRRRGASRLLLSRLPAFS